MVKYTIKTTSKLWPGDMQGVISRTNFFHYILTIQFYNGFQSQPTCQFDTDFFSKFTDFKQPNILQICTGLYRKTLSFSMHNFKSIYWIQIPPFGITKKSYILARVLQYHRAAISRLSDFITSFSREATTLCWNPLSFCIYSDHLIFIVKRLVSLHAVGCKKPPTFEWMNFFVVLHGDICKS